MKTESTVKPDIVSIEKTTVYMRRNIVEEIRTYNGVSTTFYVYEEAALTHEEYSKYSNELAAINSDRIAQLVANGADTTDNQLILMEAIADLYDVIASMM
jgi:hypothetical protein